MKRLLAILLCSFLCLTLISCGADEDVSSSKKPDTTSKTQVSSEESMTSSKVEVDTRYRATREKKPDGFKYKEAKILILGDSITAGDGTPSGYRYSLFEQLYASGARFSFVGSKQSGDPRLPAKYKNHGGTGGWKIQNITDNVNTLCNFDYDIVLILIGRNDSDNTSGITDRYKAMLDAVIAKNPKASIYCGDVLPKRDSYISAETIDAALNQKLPDICKEYTSKGTKVNFVMMNSAKWTTDMYNDAVHPNEKGNQQIARLFWDAILDEVLQINDSGDNSYVEPVHVNSVSISDSSLTLEEQTAKTISATVAPQNAEVKNILWSSSDEKIATVNEYGKITAVAPGKVKITAKSLDGNIEKVCELTVIKSTEPASTNVLTNKFDNKADWTGNVDRISSGGFATDWSTCSQTPTITSVNDVNVGNNFKMTFNYKVSGNVDMYADQLGNYSKITFNGYEIRIYNCVRTIELFANDTSIGKYTAASPSQNKNNYTLKVINGKTTLSLNGEEIISANATASGDKKVSVRIGDAARCCTFSSVYISKY